MKYRCRDPRSALWVEVRRIRPTRALWALSWDERPSSRSASVRASAGALRALHLAHLSCKSQSHIMLDIIYLHSFSSRKFKEPTRSIPHARLGASQGVVSKSSRGADHVPTAPVACAYRSPCSVRCTVSPQTLSYCERRDENNKRGGL